jgi:hypothetical protein
MRRPSISLLLLLAYTWEIPFLIYRYSKHVTARQQLSSCLSILAAAAKSNVTPNTYVTAAWLSTRLCQHHCCQLTFKISDFLANNDPVSISKALFYKDPFWLLKQRKMVVIYIYYTLSFLSILYKRNRFLTWALTAARWSWAIRHSNFLAQISSCNSLALLYEFDSKLLFITQHTIVVEENMKFNSADTILIYIYR